MGAHVSRLLWFLSPCLGLFFIAYSLVFIPTKSWMMGVAMFLIGEFLCVCCKSGNPLKRRARDVDSKRKECHSSLDNVGRITSETTQEGGFPGDIKVIVDSPVEESTNKGESGDKCFNWIGTLVFSMVAFSLCNDICETIEKRYLCTHIIEAILVIIFLRASFYYMQKCVSNGHRDAFDEGHGDCKNYVLLLPADADVPLSSTWQPETALSRKGTNTIKQTFSTKEVQQTSLTLEIKKAPSTSGFQDAPLTSYVPLSSTGQPETNPSRKGTNTAKSTFSTKEVRQTSSTSGFQDAPLIPELQKAHSTTELSETPTTSEFQVTPQMSELQENPLTPEFQETYSSLEFQKSSSTPEFQEASSTPVLQETPLTPEFQKTPLSSEPEGTSLTSEIQEMPSPPEPDEISVTPEIQETPLTSVLREVPPTSELPITPLTPELKESFSTSRLESTASGKRTTILIKSHPETTVVSIQLVPPVIRS